jgi:predicted DNA-binding transcriptional regulator AlpA
MKSKAGKSNRRSGHTRPRAPIVSLDQPGWLRVGNLMAILGVSHSTLYQGMKDGRYPMPDRRDGSRPVWNTETVKAFLQR